MDIKFYDFELVEKCCEYGTIYTFRFSSKENVEYQAGQWVHLGFLTPVPDKALVKHMSFASAPGDRYLEFTMDVGSGTPYKNKMASLRAGDKLKAFKIKGEFVIDLALETGVILLSGGIGITPARSLIRDLQKHNSKVKWSLCHVSRKGFLYEKEFEAFDNTQWRTNREGIDSIWEEVIAKQNEVKYYISGSERFVSGMMEKLKNSNIAGGQIVTESFH